MNKRKIAAMIATSTFAINAISSHNVLADTIKDKDNVTSNSNNEKHQMKSSTPTLNGIKVNKQLIDINYSKGVTIVPRYIVIHDTDNRRVGANAMANRNYFANHEEAKASAHYTVDQNNIIQCLEDTWRGWHVGDGNNPLISNSNTIGIELCVNADNNFDKTLENGIALTKYLMQKYNIPAERVVRHYDVSGKICPKMMIQDRPELWTYFKQVISGQSTSSGGVVSGQHPTHTGKVVNVSSTLNIRASAKGDSEVVGSLKKDSIVNIYGEENGWYKIAYSNYGETKFGYVSKNYIMIISTSENSNNNSSNNGGQSNSSSSGKKGQVINVSTSLNVRNSASSHGTVIAYLKNGQEVTINYEENGWYNVSFAGNKTGFVSKSYIQIINDSSNNTSSGSGNSSSGSNTNTSNSKKGHVVDVSTSLNVRSSASSSASIIGHLKNGQQVTIIGEQSGWYKITFDGNKTGYVSKSYIKLDDSASNSNASNNNGSNSSTGNNSSSSSNRKGKVVDVSTNLNVRKGPGTNYAVIAYIRNNTEVEILGEQGSWYKIKLHDGKEGYAAKQYISIQSSSSSSSSNNNNKVSKGKVVNVSTNLNMRQGPGTNHSVVAYLLPGAEVTIKNNCNGWYFVEANISGKIKTGYVKSEYIKLI